MFIEPLSLAISPYGLPTHPPCQLHVFFFLSLSIHHWVQLVLPLCAWVYGNSLSVSNLLATVSTKEVALEGRPQVSIPSPCRTLNWLYLFQVLCWSPQLLGVDVFNSNALFRTLHSTVLLPIFWLSLNFCFLFCTVPWAFNGVMRLI